MIGNAPTNKAHFLVCVKSIRPTAESSLTRKEISLLIRARQEESRSKGFEEKRFPYVIKDAAQKAAAKVASEKYADEWRAVVDFEIEHTIGCSL